MSGVIDHWTNNDCTYGHGIICQNCLARKYSEGECEVKLVDIGTFVEVHLIQNDDVIFCVVRDDMQVDTSQWLCKKSDIILVPENLWGPLFTVQKLARLPLLEDRKIAESIGNISVGHTVQVLGLEKTSICLANVTFRNSIARLGAGVFFGLQVLSPKENIQAIIKKVSLLEPGTKGFPRGCDIVVTIDKIFPYNYTKEKSLYHYDKENQKDLVGNVSSVEDVKATNFKPVTVLSLKDKLSNTLKKSQQINLESSVNNPSIKKLTNSENSLAVGEEVIYLEGDTPEKGVVKWIGYIKNSLKVGVEFENPVGAITGSTDGTELFKTKCKHASVVPPMALIKLSDYMMNNTKENIQCKNINNNNNNNINHNNNNNKKNNNNNNNKNNNNNNYNVAKSNDLSYDNKHNIEDKYKMSKIMSNSHQCLKHLERTILYKDSFQPKVNEEVFQSRRLCASDSYKSDHAFDLQSQHNSKSFDSAKLSEKKINYGKHFISLDHDHDHDHDLLQNKESEIQNSGAPGQRTPSQDLYDLMGPTWTKTERHLDSGSDNKYLKDSEATSASQKAFHSSIDVKGKGLWDSHHSGHSSSDENLTHYYDTPKPTPSGPHVPKELGKGSVVELMYKGEPHYGVIRWIGTLPDEKDSPRLIAGVEMEDEMDGFTDGTFNNRRFFHCNPNKAFFVPLSKCRGDSRFQDDTHRQTTSSKINYGQIDCPIVEGTVSPINRKGDIESICGKNRGIQGHHNSCYLDATLFSMFAFTSVFDSLLYRPPTKHDLPQYSEVQRVLREEIVNPLRKNLYVRADRVMKLRTLLDKLSSVSGLTSEEKDPEEFLNSLLAQILKAEPFLKLSSGQETFHYQLFVEKDERLVFPSVQQLFEQSFVTSDIKLKQVPSCLIIQMPRFGKSFKMYPKILPPQLLDVTDIIENSPRQCTVCGKLAEFECKDCFGQHGIGNGLESISFCKICLETAHNHHCRTRHNYRSLTVPLEFSELQEHCIIPRLYLELFAVVCIETSHYVAFVKCGSGSDAPWCFFDSMADRKGEQNGYNIPEMVPCPDLPYWLSEVGAKMINEMEDERQLPEHAKRLFSDAYMCMYQSPDLMMYR